MYLVETVLVSGLLLVQTLKRSIVPFIEAPVPSHRDPSHAHLSEGEIRSVDRSLQEAGVEHIEGNILVGHYNAGITSLRFSLLGQRNVCPTREDVLKIPDAFAVAEDDKC
jgi:hypothetical protein